MSKIWAVVIVIIALIAYDKWRSSQSYDQGFNQCASDNVRATNDAVEKDRKIEQAKQDKVDEETQKQFNAQRRINNQLLDDIGKLRKRANRKQQTEKSKSICKGSSGDALSGEDAEFLAREAARADEIRTGLKTCYNYADSISD